MGGKVPRRYRFLPATRLLAIIIRLQEADELTELEKYKLNALKLEQGIRLQQKEEKLEQRIRRRYRPYLKSNVLRRAEEIGIMSDDPVYRLLGELANKHYLLARKYLTAAQRIDSANARIQLEAAQIQLDTLLMPSEVDLRLYDATTMMLKILERSEPKQKSQTQQSDEKPE
ncbi:MAG: hypothetical protein KF784_01350 [Fimbriimonadaceae bacterium]|nr:hypothetical protein [Fimbriimonadaceae bacterium]